MTDMKGRQVPETFEQRRNQSNQKMLLGPPPISPESILEGQVDYETP